MAYSRVSLTVNLGKSNCNHIMNYIHCGGLFSAGDENANPGQPAGKGHFGHKDTNV